MSKTDEAKASDAAPEDSSKSEGVSRGTYLWCVWGAVAFALAAWWLVGGENESLGQTSQTEATP